MTKQYQGSAFLSDLRAESPASTTGLGNASNQYAYTTPRHERAKGFTNYDFADKMHVDLRLN